MITNRQKYNLFFKFIKTFSPIGFIGIDPGDPLLLDLEAMMKCNNQFFFITDIDWFKNLKHGYHHYSGNDLSNFRYPDEELLITY
jgi:hypothetical protein